MQLNELRFGPKFLKIFLSVFQILKRESPFMDGPNLFHPLMILSGISKRDRNNFFFHKKNKNIESAASD
jgi:hypothetical protein